MNKSRISIFLSILVLLAFLFLPIAAFADNDDFDVSYSFSPDEIGYEGGETQLILTVRNTGPTNIIWVDVEIDTNPVYYKRWNIVIPPGSWNSTIFSHIPFAATDLNAQKHLRISMNNNKISSPDGIKSFGFEIDASDTFLNASSNYAPSSSTFEPGDTVTLTHSFENTSSSSTITGLTSYIEIRKVGGSSSFGHIINHGILFPGAHANNVLTYTFKEADVGTLKFFYHITFDYMQHGYSESEKTKTVTVESNAFDIDFETHLTAYPLEVDAGDVVHFTVTFDNIGNDPISEFEIKNSEGMHAASSQHLSPGEYRAITIDENIYETKDIKYEVIAKEGGIVVSKETNSINIAVRDSVPVAMEESLELSPTDEADTEPMVTSENTEKTNMNEFNTAMLNNPNMLLYIILGIVVFVILIAVIVVLIVLQKRKNKS